MTPPIVLQGGTWPRCCGFPKHLEDKPGAQSSIKFSALFLRAQVLWRVCGQQSEWRAAKVTHGRCLTGGACVQAKAARRPACWAFACANRRCRVAFREDGHERIQTCDGLTMRGFRRRGLARTLGENRGNSNGKTPELRRHDKMPVKHPPRRRDKSWVPVGVEGPRAYSPRRATHLVRHRSWKA